MNRKTLATLAFLLAALCIIAYIFMRPSAKDSAPSPTPVEAEASPAVPAPALSISIVEPQSDPLYVFIMIGDGMGENQRILAGQFLSETYGQTLTMASLPISGKMTTHSLNADITDSAAGATAIATGCKTNNGMLSITPEGQELKTIIEEAEDKGLSTGIVTTTNLTNATPAAFAAHNPSRSDDSGIALNYLDSGVDFFAGGGAAFFLPSSHTGGRDAAGADLRSSRKDGNDPLGSFESMGYVTFIGEDGAERFEDYIPSGEKVFAAFSNSHMPYETERINESLCSPTLGEMTGKAIDALAHDKDGFVLMVEGGRIDHACHANDINSAVLETLAFDLAVSEAYDFYLEHPDDTLIIVLADHETGGLSFDPGKLRLQYIDDAKVSLAGRVQKIYNGDREAFYAYIAENLGLNNLNPSERARIEEALDDADKADPEKGYGSVIMLAVSNVISKRAGVSWSDTAHTGVPVPVTAVGHMADKLSDIGDNALIGQFLFDVLSSG